MNQIPANSNDATTGHKPQGMMSKDNYCVVMANWGAVTNVQDLGIHCTLTCAHFVGDTLLNQ